MPRYRVLSLVTALLLTCAAPAAADATLFLGGSTPDVRAARGLAIGIGFVIVGFEFEYSDTVDDVQKGAPRLRTGMGNLLLQTPVPVARTRFYVTAGAGGYRERLGDAGETHVGGNVGGGAKVTLAGPLRARFDFRVFSLAGSPITPRVRRFYAGVNLDF